MNRLCRTALLLLVLATTACASVSRTATTVDGDGPPRRLALLARDPQADAYFDSPRPERPRPDASRGGPLARSAQAGSDSASCGRARAWPGSPISRWR